MTGRELILYILKNGLENEPVFKNGRFIGFMTLDEAAVKMNVTRATIETWLYLEKLKGIIVGNTLFISADAESPMKKNYEIKS